VLFCLQCVNFETILPTVLTCIFNLLFELVTTFSIQAWTIAQEAENANRRSGLQFSPDEIAKIQLVELVVAINASERPAIFNCYGRV
jgi:hypothetical protein